MITGCFINLERSINVELEVQTSSRLFTEILGSTSWSATPVKAILIEETIIILFGIIEKSWSLNEMSTTG